MLVLPVTIGYSGNAMNGKSGRIKVSRSPYDKACTYSREIGHIVTIFDVDSTTIIISNAWTI